MVMTLERYEAHLRSSGAARGTIRNRTDHAAAILALGPVDQLDTAALERWVHPRGRTYKPETLKSRRASARRFLGWLHEEGVLSHNPALRLRSVHVPPSVPRVIPDDEMHRTLDKPLSSRDRAALLLGRLGCLRLSEIARAHTSDRYGDQLRILGKGGRERMIRMHPDLVHALDVLEDEQGAGYYFPGLAGPHIHPQSLHKIIKRVTGYNPHALRHAGATAAHRETKNMRGVQVMLGHASIATTQRYVHVDEDEMREVGLAVALRPRERRSSPLRSVAMDQRGFDVVEWEVRTPLDGLPVAVVRLVHLGAAREPYYRAVTANPVPELRRLIGYYASAGDAHDAALYMLEQATGRSVTGGGGAARLQPVPQKPPPAALGPHAAAA